MNGKHVRKAALCVALAACLGSIAPMALAQDGAVTGRLVTEGGQKLSGATVTVRNPQTGFARSTTVNADGSYRIPLLSPGTYQMELSVAGGAPTPVGEVVVTLGNATTVNVPVGAISTLGAVEVRAPQVVSMVDVTSTESAMNISRQDLARMPVDQDLKSVAMLAPGVVSGKSSLGAQGISFGGSSVAENAVYIDGLNVTDFYNRVGFSSAPFAFFQEFQVKTGGYSVEYGRTTGGVINAVTRSGTNEFHAGAELTAEPSAWGSSGKDYYLPGGDPYIISSHDGGTHNKLNVWGSGAIVKDRLFFFGMYEARDNRAFSTSNDGSTFNNGKADDGFWGGKLDWQITDNHSLSLLGFSDSNQNVADVYRYDYLTGTRGNQTNTIYTDTGGDNYALTYNGHLTDTFAMKAMIGRNTRDYANYSQTDIECNRVVSEAGIAPAGTPLGCTTNSAVESREDERRAGRLDFEWTLGAHLLRFGLDREENTSDYERMYPGPGGYYYNVYKTTPGATLVNGGQVPAGTTAYVRARRYEIAGTFETDNSAYYLEDNWSVTPNLLLNIGLRLEAFDNKDSEGRSYIKMDDMVAPRFGASWDIKGDGTMKLFGNVGRYFLPVANVINIKQAGGLLDERTYYALAGWETRELNGSQYQVPVLGAQIGPVDDSQGDGTVGDLRSEVDRDMDPVYQDEAILGFQQSINEAWSYGVRGIYRKLHNAIDDMEISATGACGPDGYVGWVMANPGKKVTVWGDTNCDGDADGWVTVDTAKEGWAMYRQDGLDADGDPIMTYIGQRGWEKPKRDYKALELQLDRAWDGKWSMNASYTLAYGRGNAEGPVNSDTDFADTGRTENFDDPWVNYNGYGYLSNDRRHQFKLRGAYAITDNWLVGATLDARSGGPITGFGVGNPYDSTAYHSYYVCVENCDSDFSAERIYAHNARGGYGRLPWSYELGASVTWLKSFNETNLKVKFAVYNLTNQQKKLSVNQEYEGAIGSPNDLFLYPESFQAPRYAQLVVSLDY
ncbi:TonB-dependent receptor [Stenotrophomonas sp. HITSZ_GD]|uniref:TonB-dependent receptor n=1 Tax=Stenotrophomonas sp. HITSZ_GD TaxID=3037248 RepID=UPI00240D1E70|nr:TonB-dependent receptor [Stenotrophomonas sp. HITSZ_GD]MDG2525069.1 TonB-dependent receptor [Stenotrophomonas sp. HITSZ_GD]